MKVFITKRGDSERPGEELYRIKRNVKCLKCGHIGAIQYTGTYYYKGMGSRVDGIESMEKYRDEEHLSPAFGFGGTIPYECTNCGIRGLIGGGGLEGYEGVFVTISEDEVPKIFTPQFGG
jgi:hypothetical protein